VVKVGCAVLAASCVLAVGLAQAWADPPTPAATGADASPPPVAAAPGSAAPVVAGPTASPSPAAAASGSTAVAQVRAAPPDRGAFSALWVVPFATHHFQGAGSEVGFRYRWLVGRYRIGFLQNGYAPVSGSPLFTLERTQRLFLDLEVDARWRFSKVGTLSAGGGVGIINDWVDITSMSGLTWTTATDQQWHIRPLVGVTLAGPIFQATFTAYVGSDPEGIISLGVYWGRR
jgi:hypothetical protein